MTLSPTFAAGQVVFNAGEKFRMAISRLTRISILSLLALGLSACATTSVPQLTSLEIQAIQTREFEVSKDISFGAVVTVFQDLGYIINNADKDSGFVTARSPTKNTTGFFDAWVGNTSNTSTGVSAYIEDIRENYTRIRLNFVNATSKSGVYGQSMRADEIIYDPAMYEQAFEKISEGIFIRQAIQGGGIADTAPAAGGAAEGESEAAGESEE